VAGRRYPDGLVSSLAGLYLGPTNDYSMYCCSGLADRLCEVMGPYEILYLYRDPAYRLVFRVISPFRAAAGGRLCLLPPAQQAFNRRLASVRIAVENSFGETQQQWTYIHFAEGLRPGFQPVAAFYTTAILLQNCCTCIHGSSPISRRFGVPLQSVEAYLLYTN
jgi:DDE superfamily endonuclease